MAGLHCNHAGESSLRMSKPIPSSCCLLGIEAGGTRTVAIAELGSEHVRREFGPANLRLLNDAQLLRHFRSIARTMPEPASIAIGMAGARTDSDRARIRQAAAAVWKGVPCLATNDLETALMAAESASTGNAKQETRILVLSGTGSCCFGRRSDGATAKVGGWGHILGDKGSGHEIGLRALKAVVFYLDRDGEWSELGQRILRRLQLNEPNELIGWAQSASKTDMAALAVEVFAAAARRDTIARDILEGAVHSLAKDALTCARKLARPGQPVQFVLSGSVLLKQPGFAAKVSRLVKDSWRGAVVTPLRRESVWGAVEMARGQRAEGRGQRVEWKPEPKEFQLPQSDGLSPTEQRNPRSMTLDRMPISKAIELFLSEDAKLPGALRAERAKIERGVRFIVQSFRSGGRLFYVGAGTSGRLGVLDASECPPTFRSDPELVQGIIAGGQTALWSAAEGAEDDPEAGGRAMTFRGVTRGDTVVGIAASGRTPFVWGALREAKRRGAKTILLCFNPNLIIARSDRPSLVIAPRIGPELLTGSTRLKSGTATKLILNLFTTLAMVQTGKVLGNLMIDVKASNVKLRDRAVRMVRELTGADYETAQQALMKSDWKIKEACARLRQR
jgi:N-acetylmuramic acid 6-phosphate etherase